jgi:hypothetical protein
VQILLRRLRRLRGPELAARRCGGVLDEGPR